ncbi:MAG: IPT/TIG domain-containing protein [Myxococcales bacterium]|nr:IPT/TIG domain-containing protein [Myxococcales bacterium]
MVSACFARIHRAGLVVLLCTLAGAAHAQGSPPAAPAVVTIDAVDPNRFGAEAVLTIKGSGFAAGDRLQLGAKRLELLELTANQVKVRIPKDTRRGGTLGLRRGRKKLATHGGLTFVPAPRLIAARPRYATVGDVVTLRGRNLTDVEELRVGGQPVKVASAQARSLTFQVPAGLRGGAVSVKGVGGEASLRKPYEIHYPAIIERVQPARFAAGARLVVHGKDFAPDDRLTLGRSRIEDATITPTKIELTVPARIRRGGALTIARRGKPKVRFAALELVPAPRLTAARPRSASPGDSVTLRGRNLTAIDRLTVGGQAVKIGSRDARSLSFVVPSGLRSGVVTVKSLGGEASLRRPYEIYYPPVVSDVSPKRFGAGAKLRVRGKHLAGVRTATLGRTRLAVLAQDDTSIELQVPARARRGGALKLKPGRRPAVEVDGLELVAAPRLRSISPHTARLGERLQLLGRNLAATETARIAGKKAKVVERHADRLVIEVPKDATSGDVAVESPGGTAALSLAFTLQIDPAVVGSVRYAPHAKGGARGVVHGQRFTPTTTFELDGAAIDAKVLDENRASFRLPRVPSSQLHALAAIKNGVRGPSYSIDGGAGGYRFRADQVRRMLAGRLPVYTLQEVHADLEQSRAIFAKPAGAGKDALPTVSKKSGSRKAVRRSSQALADELARITVAQRVLCAAMARGRAASNKNAYPGMLLALATKQASHLMASGLEPLWSGLPADVWTTPKRAAELGIADVDRRLEEILKARHLLARECADRFHPATKRKLVARAWETVHAGLARDYEKLVEGAFDGMLRRADSAAAGSERLRKALDAFGGKRRAFWEQRLARLLKRVQDRSKVTGKGARTSKRAKKVGKR